MKIRTAILLSVALISLETQAQKKGDSKIIITVTDTTNIYNRIKIAYAKADFAVKDINIHDTLSTFPRELRTMSGYVVSNAIISGDKVVLNGFYTRRKISYYGIIKTGKDVTPVIYFKSGKLWPLLMKVANDIGGKIEYGD